MILMDDWLTSRFLSPIFFGTTDGHINVPINVSPLRPAPEIPAQPRADIQRIRHVEKCLCILAATTIPSRCPFKITHLSTNMSALLWVEEGDNFNEVYTILHVRAPPRSDCGVVGGQREVPTMLLYAVRFINADITDLHVLRCFAEFPCAGNHLCP